MLETEKKGKISLLFWFSVLLGFSVILQILNRWKETLREGTA